MRAMNRGKVWLVGAGPGDPELLTVKALKLIQSADLVAYDELVPPAILAECNPTATMLPVGRRGNGFRRHDGVVHPDVVRRARAGDRVVRLKGGDPYIFGRGGEEVEILVAVGLEVEVVPGVTAALAAAASQRLPLTHRDESSSVTLATAHATEGDTTALDDLPRRGTLVLYMGLGSLDAVAHGLVARGRPASQPVVVVSQAALPTERAVYGTLATISSLVASAALPTPALIIVGDVVARAEELAVSRSVGFFGRLFGDEQRLSAERLEELGET